jgi:hypothetical protein
LISEKTIEENILKKSHQKKHLDDLVIQGGCFTTDFFKRVDLRELFDGEQASLPSIPITAQTSNTLITEQEWVKAVTSLEEESDVAGILYY